MHQSIPRQGMHISLHAPFALSNQSGGSGNVLASARDLAIGLHHLQGGSIVTTLGPLHMVNVPVVIFSLGLCPTKIHEHPAQREYAH